MADEKKHDPSGEELVGRPVIIYHGRCSDGFLAAFAAWLYFDGEADFFPLQHTDLLPDVRGRPVYMLDIAFAPEAMAHLDAKASRLTVLDHHQTAADQLGGFRCRCGFVHFDMTKSAARLAWEFFQRDTQVPPLIAHVEDRDLLRWAMADSEIYLASLDLGPHNFYRMRGIMRMTDDSYQRFMQRGTVLREQARKLAHEIASGAREVTLGGMKGLMVDAPDLMHNAVGELLAERSGSFALLWCLEEHGSRVKVGLRGAEGFDTTRLAKSFGGGGHAFSSAFRLPLERIAELVQGVLDP